MTGGLLCSSAARRSFAFLLSPVASSSIAVRSTSVSRIIASPGSARTPDLHEPLRRPCAIPPMPRTFRQNSRTIVRPDKNSQRREALMTPNVNFARLFAACLAALPLSAIGSAAALDYPTRPVRWIVTYPPGGGTDITARIIAQWLSERLGQQVFIENKAGGGNNIGTEAALHSPPDGYTLVLTNPANAINATLYPKLSFNFLRDIAPVAGIMRVPNVMEVHPSVPAKTVAEFIAYAKANPGKINWATSGNGTTPHVAGEMFKTMAGVDLFHVPYRG